MHYEYLDTGGHKYWLSQDRAKEWEVTVII